MVRADSRSSGRKNLASVRNKISQDINIFKIDVIHFIRTKAANLSAVHKRLASPEHRPGSRRAGGA